MMSDCRLGSEGDKDEAEEWKDEDCGSGREVRSHKERGGKMGKKVDEGLEGRVKEWRRGRDVGSRERKRTGEMRMLEECREK